MHNVLVFAIFDIVLYVSMVSKAYVKAQNNNAKNNAHTEVPHHLPESKKSDHNISKHISFCNIKHFFYIKLEVMIVMQKVLNLDVDLSVKTYSATLPPNFKYLLLYSIHLYIYAIK